MSCMTIFFYKQVQISRSDIRPHIKWAVSLVILHMVTSIFLQGLCGYIWVNILTLSPRRAKDSEFFGIFYYFSYFGTILFIIIIIKRFQYIGIFYCFSNFGTILIIIIIIILFFSGQAIGNANLRNRGTFSHQTPLIYGPLSDGVHKTILVSIHITVLDLEPNLDFQTFLIISKTYHRIFNSSTSKRRSGQELPFILFELRAPTCL